MTASYLSLQMWRQAVGHQVARATFPANLTRDGVLVVEVTPELYGEVLARTPGIIANLHDLGHTAVEVIEWRQELEGAA